VDKLVALVQWSDEAFFGKGHEAIAFIAKAISRHEID
jgi:hypothetical protein